jgi:predicted NBD/HSP70 family sugar kinase/biotin operon repressor
MYIEKASNIEVKKINRSSIYRLLYKADKLSKQDISAMLKMSLPTISQNLAAMMEEGLIVEDGTFDSTGGRKAKAISYNPSARFAVGLDITRDEVVVAAVDLGGAIIASARLHMPFCNTDAYFRKTGELVSDIVERAGIPESKVLGVGIAVPAILSEDMHSVTYATVFDFIGGTVEHFSRYIPYPCILCNDANAGGIAELWNNGDMKNVFYISLSKSVGGSTLLGNKLYPGENQRSCEIGHMTIVPEGRACYCGKKGCVDAYCNSNILSDCCGGSLPEFFSQIRNGNPTLMNVWKDYLYYLSITINNIRMLFDCKVILGGYIGVYMDDYIGLLRSMIAERNTFEPDGSYLQPCRYKSEATAVGAALLHIESFIDSI